MNGLDDTTIRRRYLMDPVFQHLVDGIRAALREGIITPADVGQALDLAVDLNRIDDIQDRAKRS